MADLTQIALKVQHRHVLEQDLQQSALYVLSFGNPNCKPIFSLSTAEGERIALSTALRETTSIMHFLKEIGAVMDIPACDKVIKCAVFEDNNGAIEVAKAPKMRPRTKHVAIKRHHFRSHI